jgi:hypothetical protein
MGHERTNAALGRIDRALARIEAAAGGLQTQGRAGEDDDLRGKHEILRDRVKGAIGDIDRLLATRERR